MRMIFFSNYLAISMCNYFVKYITVYTTLLHYYIILLCTLPCYIILQFSLYVFSKYKLCVIKLFQQFKGSALINIITLCP